VGVVLAGRLQPWCCVTDDLRHLEMLEHAFRILRRRDGGATSFRSFVVLAAGRRRASVSSGDLASTQPMRVLRDDRRAAAI